MGYWRCKRCGHVVRAVSFAHADAAGRRCYDPAEFEVAEGGPPAESRAAPAGPKECTCPIQTLMARGCRCGALGG